MGKVTVERSIGVEITISIGDTGKVGKFENAAWMIAKSNQ